MAATAPDPQDAIRLWHATSSSSHPGPVERCCQAWLDDSERQRADRFRLATSRNQNVVGRGMARRLLSRGQVDPRSIRFAVEPHGKPFVSEPEDLQAPFNVAHTDGLVLCGIGSPQHRFVGVDVERRSRRTDPELAERYFAAPEVELLRRASSPEARQGLFLRIWTLKEAFIKAIGTGLQTPLSDFAFEDIDSERPRIRMLSAKLESDLCWRFFCTEPRPGYVGAIAVASEDRESPVTVEVRCFDDLIE